MGDVALAFRVWLHGVKHKFGLAGGWVVSEWGEDNHLWLGLKCSICGQVSGAYRTKTTCPDWRQQRVFAARLGLRGM